MQFCCVALTVKVSVLRDFHLREHNVLQPTGSPDFWANEPAKNRTYTSVLGSDPVILSVLDKRELWYDHVPDHWIGSQIGLSDHPGLIQSMIPSLTVSDSKPCSDP